MTKYEILDRAEKAGLLNLLVCSGLIDPNVPFQKEVYDLVNHKIKTGQPKMDVYSEYAISCKSSETSIRRWIQDMNREVNCSDTEF